MVRGKYWSGAIFNLIGVLCLSVIALISTPLLISLMGDEVFAIFRISVVTVVSFAFLLDVGMSGSVKRYMGNAINNDDAEKQHRYMGLALAVYIAIALITLTLVTATSYWLPSYLSTPEELVQGFKVLLWSVAVYVALLLVQSVGSNIFVVYGRFDLVQLINVVSRFFLMFGVAFAVYVFKRPLFSAAIVTVSVSIVTLVVTMWLLRKTWGNWGVSLKGLSQSEIKGFFSLSFYGLLIALGPVVLYYGQDLIVVKGYGLDQLVYYVPALVVSTQLRVVMNSFASPVFSVASRLHAKNDTVGLGRLVKVSIERSFCIWLLMASPIIMMAENLLGLWMGERFIISSDILVVLVLGLIGLVLYLSPFQVLNACGKLKIVAASSILMVLMFLLFCWLAVEVMKFGLVSVAGAMAIALVIRGVVVFGVVMFEFKTYTFKQARIFLLKALLASALCFVGSHMLASLIVTPGFLGLVVEGLVLLSYSVVVVYFIMLPSEDKNLIALKIKHKFSKKDLV